jgi:hypothetical protein
MIRRNKFNQIIISITKERDNTPRHDAGLAKVSHLWKTCIIRKENEQSVSIIRRTQFCGGRERERERERERAHVHAHKSKEKVETKHQVKQN